METNEINDISFDERKSLQVMKSAVASARKALMHDGILLIIWGATLSASNFWNFYKNTVLTAWWMRNLMDLLQIIIGVAVIGYTFYYLFFRKKKVTSFASISTRLLWIGVILAHNINILITKSILAEINFVLLQPLQLVLIGFALFVSGGIYRYYLLSGAGVILWIAAAIVANFDLTHQFLIRSIAELLCFVIPGTIMYGEWRK